MNGARNLGGPQMQRFAKVLSSLTLVVLLVSLAACGDAGTEVTGISAPAADRARGPIPPLHRDDLSPQIGVNYNGQFDMVDFTDLERTGTTWVRGFFDFFLFYEDPARLHNDPKVLNYIRLRAHGHRTILNLKWNFRHRSFPEPGSQRMEDYKAFLKTMLDRLWTRTDIIVVGNEPFIESRRSERDSELLAFYSEIARFVHEYGRGRGRANVPIYIGAFNRLDLPFRQRQARDLIRFAADEPWIAGVDLHIHHGGFRSIGRTLDFIHDRIREDQRILITEYSLVWHWKSKMGEAIPADFARRHGWAVGTPNHAYIDHALKNPVPGEEWEDFLSSSYWFENRKRYLRNSYRKFRQYDKFYIATYAMRQSFPFRRSFTRNSVPWILNGIYANRTVEPDPVSGRNQFNYAWIDDFRAIQSGDFD